MIPWEHDCKTCLYNTEPKAKACEKCRRGFTADIIDRDEFMRGVQNAYQHALEKAGTHFKDIVQVVRCKDCKWHESVCQSRRADWYCPDGERREDETD